MEKSKTLIGNTGIRNGLKQQSLIFHPDTD